MIWVGLECSSPQPRLPRIFRAIAWTAFHCISSSRFCIFQWPSYAVFTEKLHSLTNVLGSGCKSIAFFSKHSGIGSAFLLGTCQAAQRNNSVAVVVAVVQTHNNPQPPSQCCGCYQGMVAGSAPDKASHGEFLWEGSWLENGRSKVMGELALWKSP